MIEITEGAIRIYDADGKEIVGWVQSEWVEDPEVVYSIANAVRITCSSGADELKRILEKGG